MKTTQEIRNLIKQAGRTGLNKFKLARHLGVDLCRLEMWERGELPTSFEEEKLDRFARTLPYRLGDSIRLARELEKRLVDMQKSKVMSVIVQDLGGTRNIIMEKK
jgi:hypothetical protein